MKTLAVFVLCLLAVAFAEEHTGEEKKEPAKVPVVPYFSYYYPYHYYPTSYYKPVSSYAYSYGTYYNPQTPVKYVVPPYVPVHYYT